MEKAEINNIKGWIAYRVVTKNTRKGTNWAFLTYRSSSKEVRYLAKRYFTHDPFPSYYKGKIITALPGSLGIFCFPSYEKAQNFIESSKHLQEKAKIIKVLGFPSWKPVRSVLPDCSMSVISLVYYQDKYSYTRLPPRSKVFNSVTFPEVLVLE